MGGRFYFHENLHFEVNSSYLTSISLDRLLNVDSSAFPKYSVDGFCTFNSASLTVWSNDIILACCFLVVCGCLNAMCNSFANQMFFLFKKITIQASKIRFGKTTLLFISISFPDISIVFIFLS